MLAPAPSGQHVALYYTLRGRLTDALTAEVGLRWDEQSYGVEADDQFGPRLNLAWRLGERTRLLASWGRYQQFQGIEELPVEDGIAEFEPAQHADHTIVGLERDVGDASALRVEAYRKEYASLRTRYENLYDPLSLAPELRWDRVAIAPSSAEADGIELLLTRTGDPWNGWVVCVVAGQRSHGRQRHAPQLGPVAHVQRGPGLDAGTLAGDGRCAIPHGLAGHADRPR